MEKKKGAGAAAAGTGSSIGMDDDDDMVTGNVAPGGNANQGGKADEEAAAVPEAFITAHDALTRQGELRPGETLLIQAVASGVGTAALQIGKAMGCIVFVTEIDPICALQACMDGFQVEFNCRSF